MSFGFSEVVLGEHDFGKDEDCDALGRFCSAPIIKRKINVVFANKLK